MEGLRWWWGGFPTRFFWLLWLLPHKQACGGGVGRWECSGGRCQVGGCGERRVCMPEEQQGRCRCMRQKGGWGAFGEEPWKQGAGACDAWAGREFLEEAIAMYALPSYRGVPEHARSPCPSNSTGQELVGLLPFFLTSLGVRDNLLAQEFSREGLGRPVSPAGARPDCNPCLACVQATPMPAPSCVWALHLVPVPTGPVIPVQPRTPRTTCLQLHPHSAAFPPRQTPMLSHTSAISREHTGTCARP